MMSIKFTKLVWDYSHETAQRRLVLLALADYADDSGRCFPSLTQVAQKCRIAKATASRIIAHLVKQGVVLIVENRSGRGHRHQYMINAGALVSSAKIQHETTPSEEVKINRKKSIKRLSPRQPLGNGKRLSPEQPLTHKKVVAATTFKTEKVVAATTFSAKKSAIKVVADVGPIRKNRHEEEIHLGESKLSPTRDASAKPEGLEGKIPAQIKDRFYEIFAEHFLKQKEAPYANGIQDFVQLASCWKKYHAASWELTEERWTRGVENYFASDQHRHTLADLASKFSDFYRSARDRYGKPVGGANAITGRGNSGNGGASIPQAGSKRFGGEDL